MNSFFYNIKIIYFISHEGYIPASEAPNLIDPPPLGMYTVVFFVCLFACFFPEEKNTNKPTEKKKTYRTPVWLYHKIIRLRYAPYVSDSSREERF